MKTVTIIGIGLNNKTITKEAQEAIEAADTLIGAPKMLKAFAHLGKPHFSGYEPEPVAAYIADNAYTNYAVLVSGDVGFFSAACKLSKILSDNELRLLPGISSVSAFAAKLGIPWQQAALISLHDVENDPVDEVRRNFRTFCLTGGNIRKIAAALSGAGLNDLRIMVGENLGEDREKISRVTLAELAEKKWASLALLMIENPAHDDSIPTGIPDSDFLRGASPMTNSEVRAISLAKLRLKPDYICYDIGAGTGSVTVEMALSAHRGLVYAIDKNVDALALVQENCRKFHVGNVAVLHGQAPEILQGLPKPDAVFIGGSSGKMREIVAALLQKNPTVRIVINAISIENVNKAIAALEEMQIKDIDIVQLSFSKARESGKLHMMIAQNPVTVISGGGLYE